MLGAEGIMKRSLSLLVLGASLALGACNSGPSSSGPASSAADEAAAIERKADHLEGLLGRRPLAARVLDELMTSLPDRVWLTEAVYDANGIQVKGNALTNNLLADYISRLGESPSLADLTLRGSSMRLVKGREHVEFLLQAAVRDPAIAPAPDAGLPARPDPAEMLRKLQMLALEAGLQMTKFVPGAEIQGEFARELPVTIEVAGECDELLLYFQRLAEPPPLWIVEKLTFKTLAGDDPRSEVRASIAAKAHFSR
jgi:hypothetical protein